MSILKDEHGEIISFQKKYLNSTLMNLYLKLVADFFCSDRYIGCAVDIALLLCMQEHKDLLFKKKIQLLYIEDLFTMLPLAHWSNILSFFKS